MSQPVLTLEYDSGALANAVFHLCYLYPASPNLFSSSFPSQFPVIEDNQLLTFSFLLI